MGAPEISAADAMICLRDKTADFVDVRASRYNACPTPPARISGTLQALMEQPSCDIRRSVITLLNMVIGKAKPDDLMGY
jgi:ferritin-like protein